MHVSVTAVSHPPPVTIEGTLVAHDAATRTLRIATDEAPPSIFAATYESDAHIYRNTFHSDSTVITHQTLSRDTSLSPGARISLVQPRVTAEGITTDNIIISILQVDAL
jgi:hypothetical protein